MANRMSKQAGAEAGARLVVLVHKHRSEKNPSPPGLDHKWYCRSNHDADAPPNANGSTHMPCASAGLTHAAANS
jgi:hypothetical protein